MACSVRLCSSIISYKFAVKNNYFPNLLICSRHLCSKDSDIKSDSSGGNDCTSEEKQKENTKDASMKSRTSRFKSVPVSDETKEAAKQKLMSLLSEITITSDSSIKSASKLNLAKAVKRISKKERLAQMEAEIMTPEKEINMAVKAVASDFKEESEKVEFELTKKLNTLNLSKETSAEEIEDTEETPVIDDKLSANLMSSVEEVAATISENPIPPRSELTKRLMRLSLDTELKSEKKSVRSLVESMITQSQHSTSPKTSPSKRLLAEKRKQMDSERGWKAASERMAVRKSPVAKRIEKVNLFHAAPLNIFKPDSESKSDSSNTFWQKLQEKELRLLTHFAPVNAFEEMIMWTEQGKHWKFPIDNETEMGEEGNVPFHEHVFLEPHLKGFPTKGPVRHFMELVCVALSKNPYLTVDRKLENIEWFRNYFKEKEEILRDAGAID